MQPPIIREEVQLAFDPSHVQTDRISEIFANETARTIWLTWRPSHLVCQHFGNDVFCVAARIDAKKPKTVEALVDCFLGCDRFSFRDGDVKRWAPVALPFFTGEKTVKFVVVKR